MIFSEIATHFDEVMYGEIRRIIREDYQKACKAMQKIPRERLDLFFREVKQANPTAVLDYISIIPENIYFSFVDDFEWESFEPEFCDQYEENCYEYEIKSDLSGMTRQICCFEDRVEIFLEAQHSEFKHIWDIEEEEKEIVYRLGKQIFGEHLIEADERAFEFAVSRKFFE